MPFVKKYSSHSRSVPRTVRGLLFLALLILSQLAVTNAHAVTNHVFFSVNGDTSLTATTQGDMFGWGANCAPGASVNFEIWLDVNGNSIIEPSTDIALGSSKITDGVAGGLTESDNNVTAGYVQSVPTIASLGAGSYIFKATDLSDNTFSQRVGTSVVNLALPNQIKGQITIPGVTAPNALLKNVGIFAELFSACDNAYLAFTNDSGFYTINIDASGTGDSTAVGVGSVPGFSTPDMATVLTSGVLNNVNFAYSVAVDSAYGFLKDETGAVLTRVADVAAEQISGGAGGKDVFIDNTGRYVINFSASELGMWQIGVFDEQFIPEFLVPNQFIFDRASAGSFAHDVVVTRTNASLYVKVTENGGLPANSYEFGASSNALASFTRGVSNTGANNVLKLSVSTLDPNGWNVWYDNQSELAPPPAGMVLSSLQPSGNHAPGDTVTAAFVTGKLVSDTIVQDVGDAPIDWSSVQVHIGAYSSGTPGGTGAFSIAADTGVQTLSVAATGYITNPSLRNINVTVDTAGGLGFVINKTHAKVTGTLQNVPTPLSSSGFFVTARTGTNSFDGYEVVAQVDSATGTYQLDLCDGTWTISAPGGFANLITPLDSVVTIGEIPDTSRTLNLVYSFITAVGDDEDGGALPKSFELAQNYPNPFNPTTKIGFSLPHRSAAQVSVYNTLGQLVVTLYDGELSAGTHEIVWDSRDRSGNLVSSGMYFYRLKASGFVQTRKMVLLK